MTRIISWNVNGIRAAARKGFFDWLPAESPDVVCLQETKASPEQLGPEFLEPADAKGGWKTYWASAKKKGYSGVAILSRREPRAVTSLGIEEFDDEGRTLIADYGDLLVMSAYFPNSQDLGARLDYKLRFCSAILEWAEKVRAKGKHLVIAGDYNIAHKPIDLAHPESNEASPGYLPEERAWMDTFTTAGYVDSFRHFDPAPQRYTWWTYRVAGARERNIGWRIDYQCVDPQLLSACTGAGIMPGVTGSDHCPVSLDLRVDLT
ncbi:MAG: exodeoxyribonuclease III [Spirochaetota bacterium]